MPGSDPKSPSRAVVLGGGGATGIAWEVGVLAGLRQSGATLSGADAVFGTSAGAFVGAALASGYDLERLYAEQVRAAEAGPAVAASEDLRTAWYAAFVQGGGDPRAVGAALGRIATQHADPVTREVRRAVVRARLVTAEWPASLRVTAIDADTGELHVLDRASGVPLADAVSASGAVPGIWPMQKFLGRRWIDGGMVSAANARLAEGFDRILVIAPLAAAHGPIPGAVEDVAALNMAAPNMAAPNMAELDNHTRTAVLIKPDEDAAEAIGPNIYDHTRAAAAAAAGHRQGVAAAPELAALWQ